MEEQPNESKKMLIGTAVLFAALICGSVGGWMAAKHSGDRGDRCHEDAETARLQACVRAGGSWVSGNCVGPLPAPEGK